MKIKSLRLKGFIGIQRGAGLDEITIDFSGVSGLVAFDGVNGGGKTTILENLHPYPQLASRDGALYHHCFRRDSERELAFRYGGHEYRTLIKIDAQGEKQEGYVWKDGTPEVNGKISSYSRYIRDLLGSPDLFFASVFCAQNSKKLSDMTTGQLKGLFGEFLRLDRLAEYETTAKQAGAVVSGRVSQVEARIASLREQTEGKGALEEKRQEIERSLAVREEDRAGLVRDLEERRKVADTLRSAVAQNAALLARKADLDRSVARMTEDMERERTVALAEIDGLKAKYRIVLSDLKAVEAILADRERIEGAAGEERTTRARAEEWQQEAERLGALVEAANKRIHEEEIGLQGSRQALKDLDNDPEIAELGRSIDKNDRELKDLRRLEHELEHDRETTRILGQIDNALEKTIALDLKDPACQSTTCSFIQGALEAEKDLPGLQQRLDDRKAAVAEEAGVINDKIVSLRDMIAEQVRDMERRQDERGKQKTNIEIDIRARESWIRKEKKALEDLGTILFNTKANIATAHKTLESLSALAARLPEIQVAEARKGDLDRQLEEITGQGNAKRDAWSRRWSDLLLLIESARDEARAMVHQTDLAAQKKLDGQLSEIEISEKHRIPAADKAMQQLRDGLAGVRAEIDRLSGAEQEIEGARAERDRLAAEMADWAYLRTACGKNGLQALEIDGAAPLITGYANKLLAGAFGPLFTVKFRTQDDEGREVLDIVVIGEDGEEILLENLSGGQRIWILMALRLAMTLLSKEKSGRVFETAFFDEMDGPLDPDNSISFISMYQAFMRTGGFSMIPFISHKPSCRDMADHVLTFAAGKNPYWR